MVRLWLIVAVAAVAFTVYAAIDCGTMPRQRVVWLLLVIILPVLGGVLWFLLGRTPAADPGASARYRGPEDDPDFLGTTPEPGTTLTDKDQDDATLRDLEDQFHERDDDGRTDR
jgi:hypothetical protein